MIADPLTWLFGRIVRERNRRYDSGQAEIKRLRMPVVSVGNLSVGGSGKTPFVQTLGRWLTAQGVAFDILSRGYGRQSKGVLRVDPAGTPAMYGDEPLLLARSLNVPVFVGEERYAAGMAAEEAAEEDAAREGRPLRLHLLDDGFQHRRLHRDFDIVLLAPGDLRGSLLPFGRLREPLSSLDRAQAVVAPEDLAELLKAPNIWHIKRRLVLPCPAPTRPLAFCGVARPKQFWQALGDIGIYPVGTYAFGDHHGYRPKDVALLRRLARQHEANGFVTTEKDLIKLEGMGLEPMVAPELRIELENMNARFGGMLEAIGVR
ncbi:MAG: tetraacyldisaccharide 4'-kinase [Acidobacteriota bacterium]|nr:tetraacyldisaccharide 4'-kinase [Acidobacteriota bacterium]